MIKTISFRADSETMALLQYLKKEMSVAYGVPVSNSDILRKALKELEFDWKYGDQSEYQNSPGWKE